MEKGPTGGQHDEGVEKGEEEEVGEGSPDEREGGEEEGALEDDESEEGDGEGALVIAGVHQQARDSGASTEDEQERLVDETFRRKNP